MKILIHGPAPWVKSAYGIQIGHAIKILQSMGIEVAQSVTYGLQGRAGIIDGVMMLPPNMDTWCNDVIAEHVKRYQPDIVLSLLDVFGLDPKTWSEFEWWAWATVDSAPLWPEITKALKVSKRQIAYSRYGQSVMGAAGFAVEYLPLCYDPKIYYPGNRMDACARLGLPVDRFIVTMVQANRHRDGRKAIPEQIDGFRQFQLEHRDAFLYMHMARNGYRGGIELAGLLDELSMVEGRDYAFVNQYTEIITGASDDMMRDTYNASNVLLQATKAEGFGLPMLEAMACGVPVIYTDMGASSEVARGYPVEWDREWTLGGSWYARPRPASITAALWQAMYGTPHIPELLVAHAMQYSIENVAAQYWRPMFEARCAKYG